MRIAIIGAGISGLSLAHQICREFPQYSNPSDPDFYLQIFEASDYAGGHTRTIKVEEERQCLNIDMGFIVFNDRTYPNFCELLTDLNVDSQPTKMSFSVSCQDSGLEYRGIGLNGLFAQRTNAFNPKFLKMLLDWARFNRIANHWLTQHGSPSSPKSKPEEITVDQFFERHSFSKMFREKYFFPMGSAVWSAPKHSFGNFPIRFIMEFYKNHGLLGFDLPQWRVIKGGSQSYVEQLTGPFVNQIQLNSPVRNVIPGESEVIVQLDNRRLDFDQVIFACHSDQALKILGEHCPSPQRKLLKSFSFQPNTVTLHTDTRVMPLNRRAWACWNYMLPRGESDKATPTYYMNMLQGLNSTNHYMVSLNREQEIDPVKVIDQVVFSHPLFNSDRDLNQACHDEVNARDRLSFCGAYWGNGFHEDGVTSALSVFNKLKIEIEKNAQLHLRRLGSTSAI